jgi:hypothetical protein
MIETMSFFFYSCRYDSTVIMPLMIIIIIIIIIIYLIIIIIAITITTKL